MKNVLEINDYNVNESLSIRISDNLIYRET